MHDDDWVCYHTGSRKMRDVMNIPKEVRMAVAHSTLLTEMSDMMHSDCLRDKDCVSAMNFHVQI